MYPLVEACSGQEQYYIRSAWYLVKLWSGWSLLRCNTPGSGIWWPRVVLTWVQLTWAQMYCLLKMGYSQPSTIVAFHIFHISLFVNTTAKVLNSYAILHMWMEVIFCQLDSSLWKVDNIPDPWHGGTSNQLRWEKEYGENCPNFWQSV